VFGNLVERPDRRNSLTRRNEVKIAILTKLVRPRYFLALSLTGLLIFTGIGPVAAAGERSTDRSHPTVLEAPSGQPITVKDDLDGSDTEFFYSFLAGPGQLKVSLTVKADQTNAGLFLDVLGPNARPLISNVLAQGVDSGSETVVKSVRLAKAQRITMKVKGIRYGSEGGTGNYTIVLGGNAIVKPQPGPAQAAPLPTPAPKGSSD
jgi:hypothetical protein